MYTHTYIVTRYVLFMFMSGNKSNTAYKLHSCYYITYSIIHNVTTLQSTSFPKTAADPYS